jgi:endonuclease/exonuclease/phosphatase family metal-dependent hydrolase
VRVRVASFNVRSFRGGVDEAVGSLGEPVPSIVLLQECGPQLRLERFARAVGGAAVASRRGFGRMRNAVVFGSSWRLEGSPIVHEFSRRGRAIPRGLVAMRLRAGDLALTAVSAHLGLSAEERERHARELVELLAGLRAPWVLGMDVNEGPDGRAARIVSARMVDAFGRAGRGSGGTFAAADPTARIDVVFVGGGPEVADAWVAPAGGSDHLAVVADLEV